MSKAATQTERVIRAARSYRGISQVDFLAPDVVDGGAPITRLAARLWEAEQQGYDFECLGRRDKCKVWRLCGEPELSETPASGDRVPPKDAGLSRPEHQAGAGVSDNPTLFDAPTQSVSPYEEAA